MSKIQVAISVIMGLIGLGTVGVKGAAGIDGRYMHADTAEATLDARYLRVDTAQQMINKAGLDNERDGLETKRDLVRLQLKMLMGKATLRAEDRADIEYCKASLSTIETRLSEIRKAKTN